MKFEDPINDGLFLKRYKRFFADIQQGSEVLTAHVPNTGSMKGLLESHVPCRYTTNDDPKRKLKYTLQMLKTKNSWVGVNTHLSNQLVWEAWAEKRIPHWQAFTHAQKEVKLHAKTRIDMVLWNSLESPDVPEKITTEDFSSGKFHFVEIKNVTLAKGSQAQFPDAVTTRGQKHLEELMAVIEQGHTAEIVFTVQRTDCTSFSPADDIDPRYGELLRQGRDSGLLISAYAVEFQGDGIRLNTHSPLLFDF